MSISRRSNGKVTSRRRVLAALRGRCLDRPPVYFEFGPFRQQLGERGIDDPDLALGVDLKKIWFEPKAAAAVRAEGSAQADPEGPRLGEPWQLANYQLWGYQPQAIDRRNPLIAAGCVADIEAYPFPLVQDPQDVARLGSLVAGHHDRGFAVAAQVPQLGGVLFETAYRLRGLGNLLEDLLGRPEFAEALLERITEAACRNAARLAAAGVDILVLGDDIGTPTSMLISPAMWREWFKPRLRRIIDAGRSVDPRLAVAYHSDGHILPVVEDLIEIGVNILNPVQPDCMDPAVLRERFGGALTLWGTVGSAAMFSFGTPQAVQREVRRRLETLGAGWLILAPAYDLEADVPLENALAFFGACRGPSG